MKNRILAGSSILLSAMAISLLIGGLPYYAAAPLAAGIALHLFSKRDNVEERAGRDEAMAMMGALAEDGKAGKGTAFAIARLSQQAGGFGRSVMDSLERYRLSGDPESSFGRRREGEGQIPASFRGLIGRGLHAGKDIVAPARDLLDGIRERMGDIRKREAARAGADAVSFMGSSLFFPAFAGICTGILRYSGFQNPATVGIAPIALFYIMAANVVAFKYSAIGPLEGVERAFMGMAVGFAVFNAGLLFSKFMLG